MVNKGKACFFATFQAHFSKLMLKIYGNRNLQWSTRGKRSLLPFLGRYSLEEDIFVVCETKVFCPRLFGEYELANCFLAQGMFWLVVFHVYCILSVLKFMAWNLNRLFHKLVKMAILNSME